VIGIVLLGVFAVCAALMATRRLPALLALPIMALAIAVLSGVGAAGLQSLVVTGTVKLSTVMITVILGALLSRVTMQTGIAETIVNYAAEFGGDQPAWVTLAMCAVVAILFSSLYGLGAIIMVGSIVLPIMMTVGVPRRTAATSFMLAYALGFIFNVSQWRFYEDVFGIFRRDLQPFAYVLAAIDACALLAFILIDLRRTRGYATWAVASGEPIARRRAPPFALVTPVVPLILFFGWGVDPILAFSIAALYGALTTQPRKVIETLVSSAIRGVEDVAPAILLFMGIGMLLTAVNDPHVAQALRPAVAAIAPRHGFGYVILFGLLSPLALYRGPLNPYGVGIGVYYVLAGLGILPHIALAAAVMAVVQVQNACDPTNTQNVWVANFTGVRVQDLMRATLPYQVGVATLATLCVVAFGPALFGQNLFASVASPAAAATPAYPGLTAPPSAAHVVAIAHPFDPLSARAAESVQHQIAGGWSGFRAIPLVGDPSAEDCRAKPYAAVLRIAASSDDVGLYLHDCAGWPVDEWHDAGASSPDAAGGRALGLLVRLRTWMKERPQLADSLFGRGLAYDARSGVPAYFYSLFKSNDGQMRAFVRPGGPAYAAGLRTNDIVVKIDGKFWWEYGTYPSQRRAYDGLPHAFTITRGGHESEVRLGAPYDGE